MLYMLTGLFRNSVGGLTCHMYRGIRRNIAILRFAGFVSVRISMSRNKLEGHAIDTPSSLVRK